KCRETIEEPFNVCWNCGTSKEADEDPDFKTVINAEAASDDRDPEPISVESDQAMLAQTCDDHLACVCGGALETGFIRDMIEGGFKPGMWVEGQPEWSFWRGTKSQDRKQYRVEAFRCLKCGRLELFARQRGEYPQ